MKRSLFLAAALLLAAGCNNQAPAPGAPDTAPAAGAGKPEVALVMKSLANEFFKTMEEGAIRHQKENADKYKLIATLNLLHDLLSYRRIFSSPL